MGRDRQDHSAQSQGPGKRSPVAEKLAKEVHKVQVKLKAKGIQLPGNLLVAHSSNPTSPQTAQPPKAELSLAGDETAKESLAQYLTITPPVLKLNLHGRLTNGQRPPAHQPPPTPPTPPPLSHLERLDQMLQPHRMDHIPAAALVPPLPPPTSSTTHIGLASPGLSVALSSQRVARIQKLLSDRPASTSAQSADSSRSTPLQPGREQQPLEPDVARVGRSRHKVQAPYWDWRASGTPQIPMCMPQLATPQQPSNMPITLPAQPSVTAHMQACTSDANVAEHVQQSANEDAAPSRSLQLASDLHQFDSPFAENLQDHVRAPDAREPAGGVGNKEGGPCLLERLIAAATGPVADPSVEAHTSVVHGTDQTSLQSGHSHVLAGGPHPLSTARSRGGTSPSGPTTRRSVQPAHPSHRITQAVQELAGQGLLVAEKSGVLTSMFPVAVAEPGSKQQAAGRPADTLPHSASHTTGSRRSTIEGLPSGVTQSRTTDSGARASLTWQCPDAESNTEHGIDACTLASGETTGMSGAEWSSDGAAPGRLALSLQKAVQLACEDLGNDTFTPRAARQGPVAVKRVQSFGKGALRHDLQQALKDGLSHGPDALSSSMAALEQAPIGRVSPSRAWTRPS